jgi:thioredoxin reductase (NADPH)
VNVGCIPKKLFHFAAQSHEHQKEAGDYGWQSEKNGEHSWKTLKDNVNIYIKSLNFGYRSALTDVGIDYINAKAQFKDANTIEFDYSSPMSGTTTHHELRADNIVIATGTRPRLYGGVPPELSITSDDIFALEKDPGTTLVLGGGYIAVECAGFLRGLGKDVFLANRSTFLRTMDQDCAERIVEQLKQGGV